MTRPALQLNPSDIIRQGALDLGILVNKHAVEKLTRHLEMLKEWGARIDLTSLTEDHEIAVLHFLDSITVLRVIPHQGEIRLLDIGTGAGFPGLVIHTVSPSIHVTLMDRDPKKIVFLKNVVKELELSGISFLNTDLNSLLDSPPEPGFDMVVSRAFSSDPELLNRLSILLCRGGSLILMAGPATENLDTHLTNFRRVDSWSGNLPFSDRFRQVILYEKIP
jgi:16S rRNA (guanine527-N7)-methyltransferase